MKKSEYPKYLRKFFIDFRKLFADKWKVQTVRILRSDNAQELQSREVQKIAEEEKCALQHSSEYEKGEFVRIPVAPTGYRRSRNDL